MNDFEEENILTTDMPGELLLTVLSSVAQQEIETMSSHIRLGNKMKAERGEMIGFNGIYGYDVDCKHNKMTINEKAFFIDKTTGKNLLDSSTLNLNVKYESGLENPNLRIKLYRRLYDSIYSTGYEEVDLVNYFSNNLELANENEYYLDKNPVSEVNYFLYQKDNLKSGTYKLEILLYDKDTYVGSVYQYLIIK